MALKAKELLWQQSIQEVCFKTILRVSWRQFVLSRRAMVAITRSSPQINYVSRLIEHNQETLFLFCSNDYKFALLRSVTAFTC